MSLDGIIPAVEADRNQLFQVVQNIILNARDAMVSGGTLDIALRCQTVSEEHPFGIAAPGDYVVIRIADSGSGIAPEDMKLLFDPFFTTKPSGHGVGLSTARSIQATRGRPAHRVGCRQGNDGLVMRTGRPWTCDPDPAREVGGGTCLCHRPPPGHG